MIIYRSSFKQFLMIMLNSMSEMIKGIALISTIVKVIQKLNKKKKNICER